MICHVFYYCNGFALIDDVASLDDELFGISLEQIEGVGAYLLQDGYNDTARRVQTGGVYV